MQKEPRAEASISNPQPLFTAEHSLSGDLRFLTACCRVEPSPDDIDLITTYLDKLTPDTPVTQHLLLITATARRHGVLPLVYKTLKKLSEEGLLLPTSNVPNAPSSDTPHVSPGPYHELLSTLKQQYMSIARRNMLMSAELLRIMKLLEENGIEALAFKGPALAQLAYGDITLRQYSDLDLLVDVSQVADAGALLGTHEYLPAFPLSLLDNKVCLEVTKDLAFHHQSNGTLIELHWKLFEEKIGRHLEFSRILEERSSLVINGKQLPTPSSEMLLVYLCLHGSRHAWERIEWICDIDRLVRSDDALSWKQAQEIAKQMEIETPFLLGLALSEVLLHTPLPDAIGKRLQTPRIEKLVTETITLLDSGIFLQEGYRKYRAIHLYQTALLDSRYKKFKHLFDTYFGISRNDCQTLPLPPALKFFYPLIKPFRVALKYIRFGK